MCGVGQVRACCAGGRLLRNSQTRVIGGQMDVERVKNEGVRRGLLADTWQSLPVHSVVIIGAGSSNSQVPPMSFVDTKENA